MSETLAKLFRFSALNVLIDSAKPASASSTSSSGTINVVGPPRMQIAKLVPITGQ